MEEYDDKLKIFTLCQYEDPYIIRCNFWINSKAATTEVEPLEVECFVSDGFTDIASKSANLFIRSEFTKILLKVR